MARLCLRRNWGSDASFIAVPSDPDRYVVMDEESIATEGSAFRPLAQFHCRKTSVVVKSTTVFGGRPAVAVLVSKASGVAISIVRAGGAAQPCVKGTIAKAEVGDSICINSDAGELLFSFTVALQPAASMAPGVAAAAIAAGHADLPAAAGGLAVVAAAGAPPAAPLAAKAAKPVAKAAALSAPAGTAAATAAVATAAPAAHPAAKAAAPAAAKAAAPHGSKAAAAPGSAAAKAPLASKKSGKAAASDGTEGGGTHKAQPAAAAARPLLEGVVRMGGPGALPRKELPAKAARKSSQAVGEGGVLAVQGKSSKKRPLEDAVPQDGVAKRTQQPKQQKQERQQQSAAAAAAAPQGQGKREAVLAPQPQSPQHRRRPRGGGGQEVPEGARPVSAEENADRLLSESQQHLSSMSPEKLPAGVPEDAPVVYFYVQSSEASSEGGGQESSGGRPCTYAFFLPHYEMVLAYYSVPPSSPGGSASVLQRIVGPSQFERDAGCKSSKWRQSFKMADGSSNLLAHLEQLYPQAYSKPKPATPAAKA